MATTNPRSRKGAKHWTTEEELYLEAFYMPITDLKEINAFKNKVKAISGHPRTWHAIQFHAVQCLGLKGSDQVGMITMADAAKQLKVHWSCIRQLAKSYPENFSVVRQGRCVFIPNETFEALQAHYKLKETWLGGDWISSTEAAERLGVITSSVRHLVYDKVLVGEHHPSFKWRISVRSVERAKLFRDKTHARWKRELSKQGFKCQWGAGNRKARAS